MSEASQLETCVFCGIVDGRVPGDVVYEDERTVAFMDANPAAEGHVLVVPRAHARGMVHVDDEDAAAVMRAAARVSRAIAATIAPDGISLYQSNESAGGQDVFHLHLHVVPRWEGDAFVEPWPAAIVRGDRAGVAARIRGAVAPTA